MVLYDVIKYDMNTLNRHCNTGQIIVPYTVKELHELSGGAFDLSFVSTYRDFVITHLKETLKLPDSNKFLYSIGSGSEPTVHSSLTRIKTSTPIDDELHDGVPVLKSRRLDAAESGGGMHARPC
jgi:hypothetical protein